MFKLSNKSDAVPAKGARRRGTSTVELAVCLPVIFLLSMGAMEGASLIFLRQAMVQSAYETKNLFVLTEAKPKVWSVVSKSSRFEV